jgi:hypothetical protein
MRKKGSRGMPPPPTFSLTALPDDVQLTQKEVAALRRCSITNIEKGRLSGTDGLDWVYISGGWPRCIAGSLKKKMAGDSSVRRPQVVPAKSAKIVQCPKVKAVAKNTAEETTA